LDPRAEELALKRLRIFARICFAWGLLIIGRLLQLQVIEHEEYSHLAQQQQERNVEIRAPRGAILDRNGQPLAMSVPVDSVCINPSRLPDLRVAADLLSRVLDVDRDELLGRMALAVENKRGFLWVKRKVPHEEADRLRSYKLDWVEFRQESSRFYPKGTLAAHLLGGVDFEESGNGGVEQTFEKELKGKPGIIRTTADVRRNVFDLKVFSDPQPGATVTLTIDERIQYVAEQELAKAVASSGGSTGSLVVMDPRTGDVLALASYPAYDPNVPPKSKHEFLARANLAVSAPFEPGSVFKVITAAAALQTTRLRPESEFYCHNGAFTLFRRVIHDAHPYGTLTMADVIAKSSNIGAIKIALQVGNEKLYEYVRAFGFGKPTGLPLPGESGGVVRKLQRWIPSSIGSVAMGHEVSTTSVQLAQACSVIASGGFLMKPRLVLRTERDGLGVKQRPHPEPVPVIKPENAMKLRMMMRGVVEYGTGRHFAKLKGYSAAGKTGSAQIYDYAARAYSHRYNASFMGFAPVNNPAIVVVVTVNNTRSGTQGFGGIVAAPVFQRVATAALRLLDIPKDMPDEEPNEEEAAQDTPEADLADAELAQPPDAGEETAAEPEAEGAVVAEAILPAGPKTPNFTGKTKREVVNESMALGVRVQMAGSGVARSQQPPPGAVLRPGEYVRVVFAR
jgi:cell division protein FtsI (penicillin-binding protein 3)